MKTKIIKLSVSCIFVSLAHANVYADIGIASSVVDQGSVQAALDVVRLAGDDNSAQLSNFYQNDNMGAQWTAEMTERVAELAEGNINLSDLHSNSPFLIAQQDIQTSMLVIDLINRAKSSSYPQMRATAADLQEFKKALSDGKESCFLDSLASENLLLGQLQIAEKRYNEIVQAGGWPEISDSTMKIGSRGDAVIDLKARLLIEGYSPGDGEEFDPDLKRSLLQYQGVQGLKTSGALDEETRKSLNVPAWRRLQTVRANIARFEGQERFTTDSSIIVNIPAFKGEYFHSGNPVWSDRVIVGRADRRTPEINSQIERVVFNPSWYVPSKLVYRDILPKAGRDPSYWERMGYQAYDRDGRVLDVEVGTEMASVFSDSRLRVKQPPGPRNALGQVKFLFPNEHAVFLHDTPNKSLFGEDVRAFSSGCVRVSDPLKLAEVLFQHQASEKSLLDKSVNQLIAAQKTRSVSLEKSVSVNTIYLTAEPTIAGKLRFHDDIYSYDTAALASQAKSLLNQG